MQDRGIVHPDMLERVQPNFYPSLCTIQTATAVDDPFGETTLTWADLAAHIDIPCRIAPADSREMRNADQVYTSATHKVNLNGYYPAIAAGHQTIVDDVTYSIEGPPQHDGNRKMTRLMVRKVE